MYSFIFHLLLVCAFIYLDLYRTLKSSQRREARFMALHCLSISSTASREVDNLSGLTTILLFLEAFPALRAAGAPACLQAAQWARTLALAVAAYWN